MKAIVFDLDSTLLFTDSKLKDLGWGTYKFDCDGVIIEGVWRPYFKELLRECAKYYDIGVWSAGTYKYVMQLAKYINDIVPLSFILTRKDCDLLPGEYELSYQKPLSNLFELKPEYNYSNTLIIDDNEYVAYNNPLNLIRVKPFEGEYDEELKNILSLLIKHKDASDIIEFHFDNI